jgi:phosphatidylglycerol:prolipoprotein diacylglycerol transferase
MYNDILTIGPVTIHGYGLMIAIGAACALIIGIRRAKNREMNADIVVNLGLIVLVTGFLGAKLLYCIVELPTLMRDPLSVLSNSGFVVYGGILGGILAAVIYCRKKGVSFLEYFDLIIPSVAVAQGFGRIGCFLAGCCYGRQTDLPIGVIFQHSDIAPNGIPLFPTQLFSSAGDFLIALILILYARKARSTGKVAGLYLILYSVGRFIIEFFRSDERGSIGVLSTSQFIAFFMLAGGLLLIFRDRLPFLRDLWADGLKSPAKKS